MHINIEMDLDMTLLRFTSVFSFLYMIFTIITGAFNNNVENFPNELNIINGSVAIVQISMQIAFIYNLKHKVWNVCFLFLTFVFFRPRVWGWPYFESAQRESVKRSVNFLPNPDTLNPVWRSVKRSLLAHGSVNLPSYDPPVITPTLAEIMKFFFAFCSWSTLSTLIKLVSYIFEKHHLTIQTLLTKNLFFNWTDAITTIFQ